MPVSERVNRLYYGVFWEMRDVVSGERRSENMCVRISEWATTKPKIEALYGITPAYSKSLPNFGRATSLSNFMGVIRWLVSLVREEDRAEVILLVMHLLMV